MLHRRGGEVGRRQGVDPGPKTLWTWWRPVHLKPRHLTPGVNAGVRATRDRESDLLAQQLRQGLAELILDRTQSGLRRPAVEPPAVVLERELEGAHHST